MSCTIEGRKMREEGRSVGYLLLQDGMPLILDIRDLYSEEIMKGLMESGYEYHDYYGNITTEAGIQIQDLPILEAAADDNDTFAGMFAQDALTEQQCLRYFKVSAIDIKVIEMHPPVKILLHTREELMNYLSAFKTFDNVLNSVDSALPINAITAREALFTAEELEQNDKLKVYFDYMANRRKLISRSRITMLEDELIAAGLMTAEQRGNHDAFLLAYTAFGPDGLKEPVINKAFERDVAYAINTPYTGTGREKNSFDTEVVRVRREGIQGSIATLMPDKVYALMDKKGNLIHNGITYPRADVMSGMTRLFIDNLSSAEMKKLYKTADSWRTQYQVIQCNYVRPVNRVTMVLQLSGGQMYEWRCDLDNVALVSPAGVVYKTKFMAVMTADGRLDCIRDVYSRADHDRKTIFRSLAKELLEEVKVRPMFENTLKLCEYCGLTAEQALDYVEVRNQRYGASELLRKELDPVFIEAFGEEMLNLPEDASYFDKLEAILSNYALRSALPKDDPNSFHFDDMLENPLALPPKEQELFFYLLNEKPIDRIEAILSLSAGYKKLKQGSGAVEDAKLAVVNPVAECLNTMFLSQYGSLYDDSGNLKANELFSFITDVRSGDSQIASISRVIHYIGAEAEGCMQDFGMLRYRQVKETKMSAYVTGVIAEQSGDTIDKRRHYAFTGFRLIHNKVIKSIIADNEEILECAVKGKFFNDRNGRTAVMLGVAQVLNFIWGLLVGSDKIGSTPEGFIYPIKYQAPESVEMNAVLQVTKSQYEALSEVGLTAPFACTMEEWCRNSFNVYGDTINIECVLANAKIDPWYVTPTGSKGEFKIYNGQINLSTSTFVEDTLKNNYPEIYQEAISGGGVITPNIRENYGQLSLFGTNPTVRAERFAEDEMFKEINKLEGREFKGKSLPLSQKDFYLDAKKYESIEHYSARIGCEKTLVSGTDRKVRSVPLKNDIYYQAIMPVYGYDFPLKVVTVPKTEPVHFLKPAGVYTSENILKLSAKTNQIQPVVFESSELLGLPAYLNTGFEPRSLYFIGGNYIRLQDGPQISISEITERVMDEFAGAGNALKIGPGKYLLVGINKRAILEVAS